MIKFLGNSRAIIDWDKVIAGLERCGHETHPGPFTGPTHKEGDDIPRLNECTELWKRNGYLAVEDGGTVQWDMFFPGVHFDQSIVDKFVEHYEIKQYESAWISRVNPGRFAPIHWDVNDNEEHLLTLPDRLRWHSNISKPSFGHVFVVDNELFYNKEQGDVFQWDSRRYWHSGMNCGLVPKYQFNLW
jgi:hypothetical protein